MRMSMQRWESLGARLFLTQACPSSAESYVLHPLNAIPIEPYFGDADDRALFEILPLLEHLSTAPDVRCVLRICHARSNFKRVPVTAPKRRTEPPPRAADDNGSGRQRGCGAMVPAARTAQPPQPPQLQPLDAGLLLPASAPEAVSSDCSPGGRMCFGRAPDSRNSSTSSRQSARPSAPHCSPWTRPTARMASESPEGLHFVRWGVHKGEEAPTCDVPLWQLEARRGTPSLLCAALEQLVLESGGEAGGSGAGDTPSPLSFSRAADSPESPDDSAYGMRLSEFRARGHCVSERSEGACVFASESQRN
jgi:hypothetical protein